MTSGTLHNKRPYACLYGPFRSSRTQARQTRFFFTPLKLATSGCKTRRDEKASSGLPAERDVLVRDELGRFSTKLVSELDELRTAGLLTSIPPESSPAVNALSSHKPAEVARALARWEEVKNKRSGGSTGAHSDRTLRNYARKTRAIADETEAVAALIDRWRDRGNRALRTSTTNMRFGRTTRTRPSKSGPSSFRSFRDSVWNSARLRATRPLRRRS